MSANDDAKDDDRYLSNRTSAGRWQVEFPFEWDADDLVGRRQLLRWSVGVAGALFAMTGLLAGMGFARGRRRVAAREIVDANNVGIGDVHYFRYPDTGNKWDFGVLLRLGEDTYVAYSGVCTHLSCEVYWDKEEHELICPCHNGRFDPSSGDVIAGPPSRPLPKIQLENRNGTIYAVDQEFADA